LIAGVWLRAIVRARWVQRCVRALEISTCDGADPFLWNGTVGSFQTFSRTATDLRTNADSFHALVIDCTGVFVITSSGYGIADLQTKALFAFLIGTRIAIVAVFSPLTCGAGASQWGIKADPIHAFTTAPEGVVSTVRVGLTACSTSGKTGPWSAGPLTAYISNGAIVSIITQYAIIEGGVLAGVICTSGRGTWPPFNAV